MVRYAQIDKEEGIFLLYLGLLLLAGILQGIMVSLNGQMGNYFSLFGICFFVHAIALVLLFAYLLAKRQTLRFAGAPWYVYLVGVMGIAIVVGAIIVFIAIVSTSRTKKKKGASGGTSWSAAANRKLKPMTEYQQLDENFDETELTSKLSNLYVQMQDCWQKKDITPIRPYCTDTFFTQMDNQLQRKKQQGQTNYIERIAVLSVNFRGWCQEGGNDVLVARLNTRIVDYTLDDKTGNLVSGSKDKEKFMVYEWDLVRTTGTKTEKDKPMQTVNCPNCGAPVEINASAKCPYCGSVITLEEHGFALNAIRAISQETRG